MSKSISDRLLDIVNELMSDKEFDEEEREDLASRLGDLHAEVDWLEFRMEQLEN